MDQADNDDTWALLRSDTTKKEKLENTMNTQFIIFFFIYDLSFVILRFVFYLMYLFLM